MNTPLGEIRIFAFDFVPQDYMICDGSALDKTEYSELYWQIRDTYTKSSGGDTFNIPDLRDRFVKGTDGKLGKIGGKDEVVLSMNQMPEHNHNTRVEVDNTKGGEETQEFPNDAYLNNNAAVFSENPAEGSFLAGIEQEDVGNSKPINIKNKGLSMVFAIRVKNGTSGSKIDGFIGEVRIWTNPNTIPKDWMLCQGQTLQQKDNDTLYKIIGLKYGGSLPNRTFQLPDLRNAFAKGTIDFAKVGEKGGSNSIRITSNQLPPHKHQVKLAVNNNTDASPYQQIPNDAYVNFEAGLFSSEISSKSELGGVVEEDKGGFEEVDITNTNIALHYIINAKGTLSPHNEETFTGEIKMYAGFGINLIRDTEFTNCQGQQLSISTHTSLYSLLKNNFGGDKVNFNLPNLEEKIPICNSIDMVGEEVGNNFIKLLPENLPTHNHNVQLAFNNEADGRRVQIPNGILNKNAGLYSTTKTENTFLGGVEESSFPGSNIDIQNPYVTINYIICKKGIHPSRQSS